MAGIFVDGVDDNLKDLEFNLNQLGELDPNLALEQVNAVTMIDEDANVLTDCVIKTNDSGINFCLDTS